MSKIREASMGIISIALSMLIALSIIYFATKNYPHRFNSWPKDGEALAIKEMKRYMINHYCDSQMALPEANPENDEWSAYIHNRHMCQSSYKFSGWVSDSTKSMAYFRCELGDQIGDYAVTIYRNPDYIGGQSYCDYIYLPKADDKGRFENIRRIRH